jgi:DNA (cytosine-5)-methyltransferase 1
MLPHFPIWDDVQTFDGNPWRGRIDVISGGFPCQDISIAGKGAGIEGGSSGLWSHMARIVGEVRPRFVFVENSPLLVQRGLAVVISDLAAMGYDARWGVLGAHHVSAPHKRERLWLVAYPMQSGEEGAGRCGGDRWGEESEGLPRQDCGRRDEEETLQWVSESGLERVVSSRLAHALDRHHAIGNGQVPLCAAYAFKLLSEKF